jgi:hypothetical protein
MSRYRIKILRRAIALILITFLWILNAETVRSKTITQSSPSVQPTTVSEIRPLGIALEEMNYPYPVSFVDLSNEGQSVRMAYMDVSASGAANGRTIVLLHGRNFSGFYWQSAIEAITTR